MKTREYSIVIRTLGTGGEKYQKLLDCIAMQTISPKNVYIIIADGYSLPKEQLGTETFVYTSKGMWHQRVYGMTYCEQHGDELQIHLDDDVAFAPDFAERLIDTMEKTGADLLLPSIGAFSTEKEGLKKRLFRYLYYCSVSYKKDPQFHIRINSTVGCTFNYQFDTNTIAIQGGSFAAFILRPSLVKNIRVEDENWLDACPYAWFDDHVFFYKAFRLGYKLMFCKSPHVEHLDHGSKAPDRRMKFCYASGRNIYIFWHRFFWRSADGVASRLKCLGGIGFRLATEMLFHTLRSLAYRENLIGSYIKGIRHARRFVRSEAYSELLPVPPSPLSPRH